MVWFQELGPDLLHRVLENLDAFEDFRSIGNTSKYFHHFIFHSDLADKLFQRHLPSSGDENINIHHNKKACGGRQYWQNIYRLRHSILRKCNTRHHRRRVVAGDYASLSPLQTLGILTEQEESQSFIYDNPVRQPLHPSLPSGQRSSVGYFGFQPLVNGTVAIWGDFDGLSVVPSLETILAPPPPASSINSQEEHHSPTNHLIYTESQQVMTILQYGKFMFLGTAAGTVHSLRILDQDQDSCDDNNNNNNNNDDDMYKDVSSCTRHTNEVTSLVAAGDHIASAAVNGGVLLHLNALKEGRVDNVSEIWTLHRSIFCMACTSVGTDTILCLGNSYHRGSSMVFIVWDSTKWHVATWGHDEIIGDYRMMWNHERRRGHNTRLVFLGHKSTTTTPNKRLVEGNNYGDVAVSDTICIVEPFTSCLVRRRYILTRCCRGGCVESIELVGTILITAGGKDGAVRTFDWDTGVSIGSIQIHPGRPVPTLPSPTNLKVAVVSTYMCHERSSLICLCRDGYLREWSFHDELQGQQESSSKKRASVPQPTRRSSRISARHG